jgi:hypothetical protein
MHFKKQAVHIVLLLSMLRTEIIIDGSQRLANIRINKSACLNLLKVMFFHAPTSQIRPKSPHFGVLTITLRHTTLRRTPLQE